MRRKAYIPSYKPDPPLKPRGCSPASPAAGVRHLPAGRWGAHPGPARGRAGRRLSRRPPLGTPSPGLRPGTARGRFVRLPGGAARLDRPAAGLLPRAGARRGGDRQVDDLGDLAAEGRGVGAEGAVLVAANDRVAHRRLDERVEHVAGGHVAEGGGRRGAEREARPAHHDFGQLAARHRVIGAEIGPVAAIAGFGRPGLGVDPAAGVATDDALRRGRLD